MNEFPQVLPKGGRLAGIDYGHVRIGVAVSDPGQQFASPHKNYSRRDESLDRKFFQQLVAEQDLVGFVVGLPVHTSGQESQKSLEARRFAAWLADATDRPIQFQDERYTTTEAKQLLNAAKVTRKKRKQRLDMLAAQMILASFLESDREKEPGLPLDDR